MPNRRSRRWTAQASPWANCPLNTSRKAGRFPHKKTMPPSCLLLKGDIMGKSRSRAIFSHKVKYRRYFKAGKQRGSQCYCWCTTARHSSGQPNGNLASHCPNNHRETLESFPENLQRDPSPPVCHKDYRYLSSPDTIPTHYHACRKAPMRLACSYRPSLYHRPWYNPVNGSNHRWTNNVRLRSCCCPLQIGRASCRERVSVAV